jgi:hypothetical protein
MALTNLLLQDVLTEFASKVGTETLYLWQYLQLELNLFIFLNTVTILPVPLYKNIRKVNEK